MQSLSRPALRPLGQGVLPAQCSAAGLAIAAGLLHFEVAPHHFQETLVFGIFMLIVGVAQLAGGLLLLARPSGALVGGLVGGTVLLLALYAVAHTTGLPIGPRPWQPEHLHTIDVLSKGTELALLWVLVPLGGWTGRRAGGRPRAERSSASGPSIRFDAVADRP